MIGGLLRLGVGAIRATADAFDIDDDYGVLDVMESAAEPVGTVLEGAALVAGVASVIGGASAPAVAAKVTL